MGRSLFIKIISMILIVVGMFFVGNYFHDESVTKAEDNGSLEKISENLDQNRTNSTISIKSDFDQNRTLDREYQSVASEIKAFIKKHNLTGLDDKSLKDINITEDVTKQQKEQNRTLIKKSEKTVDKKKQELAKKSTHKKSKKRSKRLPKLAIIMDDVGFYEDIERIKKLPFPITPSIFPQNKHYPDTANIAKRFKHYMVHFPMEAYKYKNIKEEAIKISDSLQKIDRKIKEVKNNFPNAIAINNHTGSKYTCDFDAMEEFFRVLNKYDIQFIDSRTSSGSQCKEAAKLLNRKVLQRDVFLDNRADIEYIKNQLREAVRIAKKRGYAIAICHPRDMTFKALMSSKDILKGVKLVYVNELM